MALSSNLRQQIRFDSNLSHVVSGQIEVYNCASTLHNRADLRRWSSYQVIKPLTSLHLSDQNSKHAPS